MKYTITHAVTRNGWGIWGVFLKDIVDNAKKDPEGTPIIESKHLLIGTGPGWEDNGYWDTEWLAKAVELMNQQE